MGWRAKEMLLVFINIYGMEKEGEICGLFHDVGKYSDAFQERLRGSNRKVDHSTAGAYELFSMGDIPAFSIMAI